MITNPLLLIAASALVGIAGFAGLLHLIPRLGAAGTRIGAWLCRAPGLDLVVSLVTWIPPRSEEHTSELQSRLHLVCRLLLEKKKKKKKKSVVSDNHNRH